MVRTTTRRLGYTLPNAGAAARRRPLAAQQRQGGIGDEDVDVAVFRFTLGIPGFDDRLVPRVVGLALGVLLVVNHVLGGEPTPAQVRSESLGAVLAVLSIFVPDVEERLREAMPGRGRQKTADAVEGAANGFLLAPSLTDAAKKELAWSSFALLKNTNCCGVLLVSGGEVLMARGFLGASAVKPGDAPGSLEALSKGLAAVAGSRLASVASGATPQAWLPERSDIGAFFGGQGGVPAAVPAGAQSLLVQHVALPGGTGGGSSSSGRPAVLMAFSERPRALSDRERSWASAVAAKVGPFL